MLSRHGYVVNKADVDGPATLHRLRKALTVRPPWDPDKAYGPPPKPFTIFLETPTRLYIPRFFAVQQGFPPPVLCPSPAAHADLHFRGHLKAELRQPEAVQAAMKAFETGGGMLCVPTGYGKVRDPFSMHGTKVALLRRERGARRRPWLCTWWVSSSCGPWC